MHSPATVVQVLSSRPIAGLTSSATDMAVTSHRTWAGESWSNYRAGTRFAT